jgi:phosphoadenosine phosphosulfate reductase
MAQATGNPPTAERVHELNRRYEHHDISEVLQRLIADRLVGRIALVSSFGAEAAVLLALAAEIDPSVPVLTVDTSKLFGETRRYRDILIRHLGLTDVRVVGPTAAAIAERDGDGLFFRRDPDGCCRIRKVEPLGHALDGFDAWITGRKRYQAETRASLPQFELRDGRVKVNPLASWTRERIEEEFLRRELPRHPLEADGYLSIGCYTCTERVAAGSDPRSGRWAGLDKTECGIHTIAVGVPR